MAPAWVPASPKTHVQALVKNKVKFFAEKAIGYQGSMLYPAVPTAPTWQPWLKEDITKSLCRGEMQPVPPSENKGTNWSYWGCSHATVQCAGWKQPADWREGRLPAHPRVTTPQLFSVWKPAASQGLLACGL